MNSAAAARPPITPAIVVLAGSVALLGGLVGFLGWVFEIPRLTDWFNLGITIKTNTTLCVMAAGVALLLAHFAPRQFWLIRSLGGSIAIIGGLTLLEHAGNWDFGIDTFFFDELPGATATAAPNRMGPPASTTFLLYGIALLLLAREKPSHRWAGTLGMIVTSIAILSSVGFLYGASQLYTIPRLTGIALQSALTFIVLGVGLIALARTYGFTALLSAADAGGMMMRRLILPVVILPVLVGWLRLLGQNAGLYDTAFGAAARTLCEILMFVGLLWWTARGLSRAQQELEQAQRRSEERLNAANQQLASRVDQRTAELREIIGELEAFSYTMAHDLREPLRAMQGYANILREDHAAQLDATGRSYLTRLGAAAERMHHLLADVLQYSQMTRQELPLTHVALAPLVADIIEQYPSLREAQIRIVPPLYSVVGHSGALTQIISNLLTNAAKFVAPDRTPEITVSARADAEWVTFSVRDNGIGIAAEHQERIFRMFERVHSAETYRGTGIGLAIVRRAAERMGGSAGVESVADEGSHFWIKLKRATEPVTPASSESRPAPSTPLKA